MDNNKSVLLVKSTLARLRKGYQENANRTYQDRLRNLRAFCAAVEQMSQKIHEAVEKDLGRSPFLTALTETEGLKETVDYYSSNLKLFMKDQVRDIPAYLAPGSNYVYYEPYGVALIIGSWNFPFSTTLHPMIGAIAAGNVVCIKPSEMSAHSSSVMKQLIDSLDQRVFGCIEGGADIAISLLEERWDVISFTGSPDKGKMIAAAAAKYLTPTILELGGKNPVIVDKDANMDNAVKRIVQGRYLNAGQLCISPDMALVHSSRLDEFIDNLKATISQFFGPNPKLSKDYARIINDMHTKRIAALLEGHNGKLICGGEVDFKERYIAPTVILNPDLNSPVGSQEIFGPILVIFTYNKIEECIELINSREKPLALYYFGGSRKNMELIKLQTSSGNLTWNDCVFHYSCCDLPFGGVGTSGISKMFGEEGFRAMCHPKSVAERFTINSYPASLRYPPFTESSQKSFLRLKHYLGFSVNNAKSTVKKTALLAFILYLAYKGHLDPIGKALNSLKRYAYKAINPRL